MSDKPEQLPDAGDDQEPVTGQLVERSTALAIPTPHELDQLLGGYTVNMRDWLAAMIQAEQFEESDTEDQALAIIRAIVTSKTSAAVFAAMDLKTTADLVGPDPGDRSNVLEIRGARPLASTYDEGPGTFIVIDAYDLAEQYELTFSCGAAAVQAAIWAHIANGWMPMKAAIVRRRKPTRKGFYPLNLESGI